VGAGPYCLKACDVLGCGGALGVFNMVARSKMAAARSSVVRMRDDVMDAEWDFGVCWDWLSGVT
jgi:hypothetical protein